PHTTLPTLHPPPPPRINRPTDPHFSNQRNRRIGKRLLSHRSRRARHHRLENTLGRLCGCARRGFPRGVRAFLVTVEQAALVATENRACGGGCAGGDGD